MLLFILLLLGPAAAEAVSVALLPIENLSMNPRYDYLEGIIKGILLYDLSSTEGINVVDRAQLESVLREQELRLGSLSSEEGAVLEIGKILGADYLLKGEYVFLGREVLVTATLIDVVTARSAVFSERGSSENILHSLAEQLIFRLTGRELRLQSNQRDRSIISMQDETPGTIALHSHLIDAEIFLDDEFVGYTTGDERTPFIIDDLSPELHRLRIHLQNFGIVKEPEITFHDWEEELEVKPGKRHVVRAGALHFNTILYRLQELVREEIKLNSLNDGQPFKKTHDASFLDRQGKKVQVILEISVLAKSQEVEVRADLAYQGKAYTFAISNREGEAGELQREIDKIKLDLELDRYGIDYSIWRTDISQNMFY